MDDFWVLLGQIFSVVIIQSVLEMFIEKDKRPHLSLVLSIACYGVSLYLVAQFVFDSLIPEIQSFFSQAFR